MAVAQVVDVRVNPNDTSQHVVLWGNGRVDSVNCPSVGEPARWYDRIDQPVARAIHITNWSSMSGYVLDHIGVFHRFGDAPELGSSGVIVGVPLWPTPIYVDWSWDPNNAGRGVVLDGYGTLHAFGGAPTPPRTGNRWNVLAARRLVMTWGDSPKAYTLDYQGGIQADYAAASIPASAGAPYWPGQDIARDLVISDWTTGAGWTLDWWGGVHQFGGAAAAFGGPYQRGGDWARRLLPLSLSDPLRFLQVWAGGQEYQWTASTAPTVVAGGFAPLSPASTVTGTSRPVLAWAFSDAQNDSQAAWEVAVFTSAFATANDMSNPWAHLFSAVVFETGVGHETRGIASPKDLPNGGYRMYVRAQDTAGQWSAWANRSWTQSITPPATPTGLSATPNAAAATVALSVSATPSSTAKLVRFDCSDDAGATWAPVAGAEAVPIATTTTAVDLTARLGVARTYRAVAYSNDPRVASVPSGTATATLTRLAYFLTALDDSTLGGEVGVQGPFQWDREMVGGIFEGLGAKFPTVVDDGEPKARRGTLRIICESKAEWARIQRLAEARTTVLLRDPYGDVAYCRMVGNWPQLLLEATEKQMYGTELPLIEVAPPHVAA